MRDRLGSEGCGTFFRGDVGEGGEGDKIIDTCGNPSG